MLMQGIASKQSFLRLPTVLIQVIRDFNLLKKDDLLPFFLAHVHRIIGPTGLTWCTKNVGESNHATTLMVDLFVPCLHQSIAYQHHPEVCNHGLGRARQEPAQCNNRHLNEMMP